MDKPETRQIVRFFMAGANDVEVDKQGRILLPATLIRYAEIDKEAVIAGVGNRIEIWNKQKWEDASTFDNIDDIAAKMSEWGLSI
jgi:MraZ protein